LFVAGRVEVTGDGEREGRPAVLPAEAESMIVRVGPVTAVSGTGRVEGLRVYQVEAGRRVRRGPGLAGRRATVGAGGRAGGDAAGLYPAVRAAAVALTEALAAP
jgi:putative ABC transport system permease protein